MTYLQQKEQLAGKNRGGTLSALELEASHEHKLSFPPTSRYYGSEVLAITLANG